ncbi:unnamed protein product [Euphydryas editha]|uniref:Uncharacterized protein n=1 Tax=Euphydryas editha TaxID=104508 RepID=A0AAU9U0B0_EUPED|nr:unnamed protein product [Euphydryas editha]
MFYRKCFKTLLYIVKFFLIWCVFVKDVKTFNLFKGNLPDPLTLSRAFNTFVGPIIKSFPAAKPIFRTIKKTAVDAIIRQKVAKLRPFLQDDDVKNLEENIFLEDKDDTTIIEFLPKTEEKNKLNKDDVLKTNIKKFKKIRENINKALMNESVSDKTKNLVIETLDDLIKKLVGSQCKWKRNLRAEGYEEPAIIANRWNRGLHTVKTIISSVLKNDSSVLRRNNDVPKFLDNLQILFRSISKDVDMISKKYRIQCEFVPKNRLYSVNSAENEVNALRNSWNKPDDEDNQCQNIVICSNELTEFMRNFYISLNDTSVSVIRNYGEMYARDVISDDENESNVLITLLNNVSVNIEGSVKNIFIKETIDLQLDKDKNIDSNINALSNYVKNTIEYAKASMKRTLKAELVVMSEKIQVVVYDDIKVNIDVDLSNLEREIITKICNVFRLCNGRYDSRRLFSNNTNKNNLFVQVELTLDDNMIDIKNLRRVTNMKNGKNKKNSAFNKVNEFINVTRTTHVYDNVT